MAKITSTLAETPIKGLGFVRLVVVSLTAGTKIIASFGQCIDLVTVEAEKPMFSNPNEKTSYSSKMLTTGIEVKHAKLDSAIYAANGSAASKTDKADKISFTASISGAAKTALLTAMRDTDSRFAVCIGAGRKASNESVIGYYHLIGRMLGDIEEDLKEDIVTVALEVEGGEIYSLASGVDYTDYNTNVGGAGTNSTITPAGRSAVTIPDVTSDEFQGTNGLTSGKIVFDAA